uniref:Retrotransposon gag domain-containing protein n=1 Tax=Arabidopsis halleri subsp. halleri TaxID=81971 RepID=I0J3J0_ARAHH|nr:unknown [Arabidopsis halleri subsp. halleri]
MESIEFYSDEEIQGEEPYQVMSDEEDNYGSISWHDNDHSDSESRDEPGREAPEPEPPDSYNTNTGYSKPWIKFNDDFCSHEKKNYLKWEDDMEYEGATTKECHKQRPLRREEKPYHHILSHQVPTTSRQAKPRDKYFHTNPRVVQEVTQEVTQRASIWLKPHPHGRRDYLAERDSRTSKLKGGKLKHGANRDPLLSNPTRTYKTKLRLSLNDGYEYFGPEYFEFTGRERDYLKWELNMEKYFRYYSIPKEERLNYCLEQLMGSAKRWWDREEKDRRWYREPALKTWGQLKLLMRERYAPHMLSQPVQNSYLPKEPSRENTIHQHVSSNHNADQDSAKKNEKGTCARGEPSPIPEQLSETTTSSQVCRNKMYDQAALKERVIIQPCSAPTDLASKIIHIKAELIPNTLHGTQVSETYYLVQYWHSLIFERNFKNPIISISSIMHLILSLSASESTCTMKICEDQREATTVLRLLSDQSKQEVDSGLTHEKVQSNLFHYVYECPLTALIHLSCAKSIETHR